MGIVVKDDFTGKQIINDKMIAVIQFDANINLHPVGEYYGKSLKYVIKKVSETEDIKDNPRYQEVISKFTVFLQSYTIALDKLESDINSLKKV